MTVQPPMAMDARAQTAYQIISATLESGKIKLDDPDAPSMRYARYLPFWA